MRGKSQLGRIVGEQTGVQVLEVEFCRHLALKPPLAPIQDKIEIVELQQQQLYFSRLIKKKNLKPKPKTLSTGEKDRLGVNGENKREVGIVLPGNRTDRPPHGRKSTIAAAAAAAFG
ncbi:hypothetical protein T10_12037 [Trichinella papuae]|uniref:Uncharacterized protein n=1 Tax=Trichinella papuae TaxID=268474 RepID=A0A0V1MMQ4_9BILA|nr:hypothetical protein T10_12037 [Trichinella papuae]